MSGSPGFMTPKGAGTGGNPYSQTIIVPGAGNIEWALSDNQIKFKNFMIYNPGSISINMQTLQTTGAAIATANDMRIVPGVVLTWYRRKDELFVSFSAPAGPNISLEVIPFLMGLHNH